MSDTCRVFSWASRHKLKTTVASLLRSVDKYAEKKEKDTLVLIIYHVVSLRTLKKYDLMRILLMDKRIDPSAGGQDLISSACEDGHVGIVKALLADKRVDPSANDQQSLHMACEYGHLEVVQLLLSDSRVDPAAANQHALRLACDGGHVGVVKALLADKRVNPGVYGYEAICDVVDSGGKSAGHVDVMKALLADQRVDPSIDDQYPICTAVDNNQLEVVKALLADQRVDPAVDNQYPIRKTVESNHPEMLKVLLSHPRVNPSIDNQLLIRMALGSNRTTTEVVKLLLADQRVSLSGLRLDQLPHPHTFALLALRLTFRKNVTSQNLPLTSDHTTVIQHIDQIDKERKSWLDDYLVSDLSSLCLEYVPDLFCHLDALISSLVERRHRDLKFPRFVVCHLSTL
jgi:ankyrin repeat protein